MEDGDADKNTKEVDRVTAAPTYAPCIPVNEVLRSPLRHLSISPSGEYVLAIETAAGKSHESSPKGMENTHISLSEKQKKRRGKKGRKREGKQEAEGTFLFLFSYAEYFFFFFSIHADSPGNRMALFTWNYLALESDPEIDSSSFPIDLKCVFDDRISFGNTNAVAWSADAK